MRPTFQICDRCQQQFELQDDRVAAQLLADYPGQHICLQCDRTIQLSAEVSRQAALNQTSPEAILRDWIARYSNPSES